MEIGLAEQVDLDWLRRELDAALPTGLDIVEAVAAGPGSLAERIVASLWRVELPGVTAEVARAAVETFLDAATAPITRMTKSGLREVDARAAVVRMTVLPEPATDPPRPDSPPRAILELVVRQTTPAVRPEDVMTALSSASGPPQSSAERFGSAGTRAPAVTTRLAQGPLGDDGSVGDPLAADRRPPSSDS